jgi:hypothetical protein
MKIAMTISGQPRSADEGFIECKKWLLDKYDIDVYLHAWNDKEFFKYDFFNEGKIKHIYKPSEKLYSNILDWYQPKDYLFEKAIKFDATDIKGSNNQRLNSQLGMWMSLKRAWDLVEASGIKYDYVIRTRYDLKFTDHVSEDCPLINDILNNLTIEECSDVFKILEDSAQTWKSEIFYSSVRNYLLRMCNGKIEFN